MFSVDFNVSAQFEKIILQPRNYNRLNIYKGHQPESANSVRDLDPRNLLTQVDAILQPSSRQGIAPLQCPSTLGYRMAVVCALYTVRYISVPSPLRGRNTVYRQPLPNLNPRVQGLVKKEEKNNNNKFEIRNKATMFR